MKQILCISRLNIHVEKLLNFNLYIANSQDSTNHSITDFVSFFSLPSAIIGHQFNDVLNAAYLFYRVAGHQEEDRNKYACRFRSLINNSLILAKKVCWVFFKLSSREIGTIA